MTTKTIEAHKIVEVACSILKSAKERSDIKVPRYTRSDFSYDVKTKYKEVLDKFSIPLDMFGVLFGNKSRWDASLCRFFALSFINFFIESSGNPHKLDVLSVDAMSAGDKTYGLPLSVYKEEEYSLGGAFSQPHLFTADPRVISIKAFVPYPNTTLCRRFGSGFMSKKWVNIRYELDGDFPKMAKLPAFVFDETLSKVTPRISESPGFLFKFSYCELSRYLKELTYNCFLICDGKPPTSDMSCARKVLDIVNVILKDKVQFEVHPFVEAPTAPPSKYRINGDELRMYVRFPSMRNNEAFSADKVKLSSLSVFDLVGEESNEIQAILFTTDSTPRVEVDCYVQWDDEPRIVTQEILSESDCIELF